MLKNYKRISYIFLIAGIDRAPVNGSRLLDRTLWAGKISERLNKKSLLNIKLFNKYDDAQREGLLNVRLSYTSEVAKKQCLSMMILENGILDAQEYPDSINHSYTFKHIFHKLVTPIRGIPILDSLPRKSAGRVYETKIRYSIDPAWTLSNCNLVVLSIMLKLMIWR